MKVIKHLVNGEIVSMGDPTQDVFNPSTGEVSKQVEIATKTTVEKAITAAQDAFPEWRATPPIKRARIMFRFKELLEKNTNKTKLVTHYEQLKTQSNDNGLKVMMELVRKQVDENLILAMMKAKRPDPNPPNAFEIMLEATKKKLHLDQVDIEEKYKPYSATLLKNYTPKKN